MGCRGRRGLAQRQGRAVAQGRLKKELESYKANKPWREALPEGSKKAKSPDKKTEKTTKSRDGSTSAK